MSRGFNPFVFTAFAVPASTSDDTICDAARKAFRKPAPLLGLGPAPRPAKGQLRWFVPWFREEQAWDFQAVHVALAKRFPLLVAVSDTSEGASGGTTFDLYRDGKLTLSLGRRCVFEGELKLPMAKRAKLSDSISVGLSELGTGTHADCGRAAAAKAGIELNTGSKTKLNPDTLFSLPSEWDGIFLEGDESTPPIWDERAEPEIKTKLTPRQRAELEDVAARADHSFGALERKHLPLARLGRFDEAMQTADQFVVAYLEATKALDHRVLDALSARRRYAELARLSNVPRSRGVAKALALLDAEVTPQVGWWDLLWPKLCGTEAQRAQLLLADGQKAEALRRLSALGVHRDSSIARIPELVELTRSEDASLSHLQRKAWESLSDLRPRIRPTWQRAAEMGAALKPTQLLALTSPLLGTPREPHVLPLEVQARHALRDFDGAAKAARAAVKSLVAPPFANEKKLRAWCAYYEACSEAQLGHRTPALAALKRASELEPSYVDDARTDPELAGLR